MARNGTVELALWMGGEDPFTVDELNVIAADILSDVPRGAGASRWELSDEDLAEASEVLGIDVSGDVGGEPPMPVPPGATTESWFCSPFAGGAGIVLSVG